MIRVLVLLVAVASVGTACGSSIESVRSGSSAATPIPGDADPGVGGTPIPVEPDGGIGDSPMPVEPDGGIGDSPLGTVPFFGGNDTICPSTTLRNELDDETVVATAVDCFMAAYEAGTPLVWDLSRPTVEGDPIYHRFFFDGESVTIVVDNRLDAFGSPQIDARSCGSVVRGAGMPEGIDCTPIEHRGFPEAG